ncbi:RTC4-like domain-containing protein [Truncatella angustata]|uniref:Restriction of telomere capping protein 4 n=1 Tax=Truncatella angustata TaxID=152316 RepID=A0A9P9A256_9PEZI|nr:RTC4-like domain-containing protein [Truncatella angustata]KAH6660331.1 RTC4-like domain-containing protein [Truncatella angustata]KAH8193671.1 hypothetical protein TruAng_012160 [Truncatella angustata]
MADKKRTLGLSKLQRPPRLLAIIRGRSEDEAASDRSMAVHTNSKFKEPAAIDAPPVSSDEDNDDYEALRCRDSSDSDAERNRKSTTDIKPYFGPESKLNPPSSARRRISTPSKELSQKEEEAKEEPQENVQPSSAGSKRSADKMLGKHLMDSDLGFTKTSSKKLKRTFSGKASQKPAHKPTKKPLNSRDTSPPRGQFHKPPTIDSPSPVRRRASTTFKDNAIDSSLLSSPVKRRPARTTALNGSPGKAYMGLTLPDLDFTDNSPHTRRSSKGKQDDIQQRKNSKALREDDFRRATSPVGEFKSHFLDSIEDLRDLSDDVSKPMPSTQQVEHEFGNDPDSGLSSLDDAMFPKDPRCPMCHELVDPKLLKEFTAKGRMNVKKQTTFCRLHRRKEAEGTRKMKGYPKVDWNTLEPRFEKYDKLLKRILEGEQPSYYAAVLGGKVEAGESRTLLKAEENLIPGYYGPRGLRVMTDYIMRTFSDTLRRRTIEDRLVSSRGYSGYVQAVLVPELAVHLIMEDMNVSEEGARNIMSESSDVGELVHEEMRDVVSDEEEH